MSPLSPMQVPLVELDLLRTLTAIAETGNFSTAAAEVGRTPSAVSMQVKRLEDLLQRKIFVRDSRSVRLTADGTFLLDHARRALALNREAVARFVEPGLAGEIRLGAPDEVAERYMTGMLRRFSDHYPDVSLTVVVDGTERLIEQVAARRLDLAVITCEAGFEGDDDAEILHREPLVWACLRGSSALEQEPLPLSFWEDGCSWRDAVLEGLERQGRAYRVAFECAQMSGQRACLFADLAIATLPASTLDSRLVKIPDQQGLPELPYYKLGMIATDDDSAIVEAAKTYLRACFADI